MSLVWFGSLPTDQLYFTLSHPGAVLCYYGFAANTSCCYLKLVFHSWARLFLWGCCRKCHILFTELMEHRYTLCRATDMGSHKIIFCPGPKSKRVLGKVWQINTSCTSFWLPLLEKLEHPRADLLCHPLTFKLLYNFMHSGKFYHRSKSPIHDWTWQKRRNYFYEVAHKLMDQQKV